MSLTRYAPQLARSFRLAAGEPLILARCAALWLTLALAAHFARGLALPGGALIPFVLNALAFGAFAVAWQRFVALGERPATLVAVRLGARELAWAVVYQLFLGVEAVVNQLFALVLQGQANAPLLALAGTQAFQLLIGPMLVMLPHIALGKRGGGGPTLQEMVLAGGLAVGLGYVLAGLPFILAGLMLAELAGRLPAGAVTEAALPALQLLISFAATAVMAGYFALVWQELRATTPSRLAHPDPEPPAAPAKPRRTHRLSKRKR